MRWFWRIVLPFCALSQMLDMVFGQGLLYRLGAGLTFVSLLALTSYIWSDRSAMRAWEGVGISWVLLYVTVQSGYRALHGSFYELCWFAVSIVTITVIVLGVVAALVLGREERRVSARWRGEEPSL